MEMRNNRPLSPHISIHKKVLTAVFSICHRVTGIGLSFGSILICIWIGCIAIGEKYFLFFHTFSSSFVFKLFLFFWSIAIFYHLFNGLRYLSWSFGYGMSLNTVYKTSYIVVILTILSTIILWLKI